MRGFNGTFAALAFATVLLASAAQAAPVTLTYEGDLRTDEGALAQGMHNFTFALYEGPEGGDSVWTETHLDLLVVDGHFFADLGSMVAFDEALAQGEVLYLGVSVDGDAEATPRMTVGGALRAHWASVAENARDVRGATSNRGACRSWGRPRAWTMGRCGSGRKRARC